MKKQTNNIEIIKKQNDAYISFTRKYTEIIDDTIERIHNELSGIDEYKYMDSKNLGYILRNSYKLLQQCKNIALIMVQIKNGMWQRWAKNDFKLEPNQIYILTCIIGGKSLKDISCELVTSEQVVLNTINRISGNFVNKIVENNSIEMFNNTYPQYKITCKGTTYTMKNFRKWLTQEILSEIEYESEMGLLLIPQN